MRKGSIRHPRINNLQWCHVCQQYKGMDEFHVGARQCKLCRGIYQKGYQHNYYLKYRDELLPKHRLSATKSNRGKGRTG